MGVKSVLALAFVLAVVAAANIPSNDAAFTQLYKNNSTNSSLSHNLIVGSRLPGDRLVLQQSVVKSSSWMQVTTWQQTFNATIYTYITQVRSLDQKTNGNGARASIIAGGPGYNYVRIKFTSQRGHGINHILQLFAR